MDHYNFHSTETSATMLLSWWARAFIVWKPKQHQNLISDIDEDVDTLLQIIKSSYNQHNEFFYLNQTHPKIVHTSISSKFLVEIK